MKKIGLITFHESDNYGTCLQALAMQKNIEDLGYTCELIPFKRNTLAKNKKPNVFERIRFLLSEYGLNNLILINKIKNDLALKNKAFKDFRNNFLKYSNGEYSNFEDLKENSNLFDAFVCGSDMIWSSNRSENLDIYFLQFAPKGKRIAYSPSFGSDFVEEGLKDTYSAYIKDMDFLSCRETSGVKLIKDLSGTEAKLTIDPTLLLKSQEWNSLFRIQKSQKEPYILVYMFEGVPKWMNSHINKVAKKFNAKIVEIPMSARQWCNNHKKKNGQIGPLEFVSLFANAKFVFTNSYHGLMFSLIYNIPFFAVKRGENSNWMQFEERLMDTLKSFGCQDRVLTRGKTIDYNNLNLNFNPINKAINTLSESSMNYLKEALSIATKTEVCDD